MKSRAKQPLCQREHDASYLDTRQEWEIRARFPLEVREDWDAVIAQIGEQANHGRSIAGTEHMAGTETHLSLSRRPAYGKAFAAYSDNQFVQGNRLYWLTAGHYTIGDLV